MIYELLFCGSRLGFYADYEAANIVMNRHLAMNPEYLSVDFEIIEHEVKS